MYNSVVVCGSPTFQSPVVEAYWRALGNASVSVVENPEDVECSECVIDARGIADREHWIKEWQTQGNLIVIDRPPATTPKQSLKLLESAQIIVTQSLRYDPRWSLMSRQVRDGEIGDLVAFRIVQTRPQNCFLEDGIVQDHAFGALDAVGMLVDGIQRVTGRQQRLMHGLPDALFAVLVADNGAIGYIELSCCQPAGCHYTQMDIVGSKGILEYDSDINRTLRIRKMGRVEVRDAFHQSPLDTMLNDYLALRDDGQALRAKKAEARTALILMDRLLRSCHTDRPA